MRLILLFLVSAALLFPCSSTLAEYRKVRLLIGQQEVPVGGSVLFDGHRVYAPTSALKSFGIEVAASADGRTVSLVSEQPRSAVFGVVEIEGVKMVAVDDILKHVGGDVRVDTEKLEACIRGRVRSVGFSDGLLKINCSIPLRCKVSLWNGKLIVDVLGARLATEAKEVYVGEEAVEKIRLGQYTDDTARVVLDLTRPCGHKLQSPQPSDEIILRVAEDIPLAVAVPPKPTAVAQPFAVTALRIEGNDESSFEMVIETDRPGTVSVAKSYYPSEITLLMKGATLLDSVKQVVGDHPLLVNTRFVQASSSPPLARVHMNLTRPVLSSVRVDANRIRVAVRLPDKAGGTLAGRLVVVDPGHGGSQPGAIAGSVKEKDVNMSLAQALASALEEAGARVMLTRTSDVTMDLTPRPAVATANGADFFISLHCNSNLKPESKSGIETYFYRDGESAPILANAIQKGICVATGMNDGGARDCGFKVLRLLENTGIPGVLVECGYLNHSQDRAKLLNEEYRKKLASGIVAGLKAYVEGAPL